MSSEPLFPDNYILNNPGMEPVLLQEFSMTNLSSLSAILTAKLYFLIFWSAEN